MAQAARYYDPRGTEVPEPKLLWADRVAIALWLLTGGLIGLVYAIWGDPGTFLIFEKIVGTIIFGLWFAARALDWAFTGRIRYGT